MNIKDNMLKMEKTLSPYATKDEDALRMYGPLSEDIRPNYFRDIDRIIYSLSYTRYIDKTQVFSKQQNDHISKRIIHVQLVSKIARTIGRALNLNEDLIEAIALGHDIGHVPYGHLGEKFLDEISMKNGEGHFMHNVQSVRTLEYLEDNGRGKNLCVQTLDGILCHNGEFVQSEYRPRKKTIEDFLKDYYSCYENSDYIKNLVPMTLEGCVVRISDIIGYLGRDIEDAVRLKVFDIKDIPNSIQNILGKSNHDIVSTITQDIIENSLNKDCISMSKEIYEAIRDLKNFNNEHIYSKANDSKACEQVRTMFNELFEYLVKVLEKEDKSNNIYKVYLDDMDDNYIKNTSKNRIVIDYISGMTDEFFTSEHSKIN